ncbi:MAG: hypothetical protein GF388_01785 [Candidatus Aegiribacteria sp.]|nr:hypothetical protein [Candidatus Aegiribacteria sp.]
MKLRLAVIAEYKVEEQWYPENASPEDCAKIDQENFKEEPHEAIALIMEADNIVCSVTTVKDES